jgi:anti-sigma factor RsiW
MISELDQQLLDEYLDGQLAPADAQRLGRRLALETQLADELAALRAERAVRQSVFTALTPEPKIAEAFSRRVASAARRQALRTRFGGMSRIAAGIAACVAIGFAAGWIGRGHGAASAPTVPAAVARNNIPSGPSAVAVNSSNNAGTTGQSGQLTGPYQMALTDPDGHVLAVQKFDRIEDAAAAADTLGRRLQSDNNDAQAQTVVYADHF